MLRLLLRLIFLALLVPMACRANVETTKIGEIREALGTISVYAGDRNGVPFVALMVEGIVNKSTHFFVSDEELESFLMALPRSVESTAPH
ncbi:hypothetical protein IV102_31070 [bacterium]|nr:hypothetical protein [bacterium]